MNQLTLHYVKQADHEREIAHDLRDRQILDADDRATAAAPAATAPAQSSLATSSNAPSSPDRRQAPFRARAAGR